MKQDKGHREEEEEEEEEELSMKKEGPLTKKGVHIAPPSYDILLHWRDPFESVF